MAFVTKDILSFAINELLISFLLGEENESGIYDRPIKIAEIKSIALGFNFF